LTVPLLERTSVIYFDASEIVVDVFGLLRAEPILEFFNHSDLSPEQQLELAEHLREAHQQTGLDAEELLIALQRSGTSREHLKLGSFSRIVRSGALELRTA
jgi:hypothetical protein